jgi:hypothetical protein
MVKTSPAYDTIGPHPCGHGKQAGGQDGWNADALTLFGNRSPATCARASRRR